MATPRNPLQSIAFLPGSLDTSTGVRHLPLGGLVEAQNVRQVKRNEWRKREGFTRTVPTTDTGSFTGPPTDLVYAGAPIARDAAGAFWSYDSTANQYRHLGTIPDRPFPSHRAAGIGQLHSRAPVSIPVGSDVWTFAVGDDQIQSSTTGPSGELKGTTTTTQTGVSQLWPVYDATNACVWVFFITTAATTVKVSKYMVASPSGAPATTTVATTTNLRSLHAAYLSSPDEIAVTWTRFDAAGPSAIQTHGYLDRTTPTGLKAGSVTTTNAVGTAAIALCGGIHVLGNQTGATSWHYSFWRAGSAPNTLELVLRTITTATQAIASTTVLLAEAVGGRVNLMGVTAGHVDAGGDRVVLAQWHEPGVTKTYNAGVNRYTYNGSITLATSVAGASWLASGTVLLNGQFYFVTSYEPGRGGFGRALHLRRINGQIVAQALPGEGPPQWQTSFPEKNGAATQLTQQSAFVTNLFSPGANKLSMAAGRSSDTQDSYRTQVVTWDFAATYGKPAVVNDRAIFPASPPLVCGARDRLRELTPMYGPPEVTVAAGGGAAVGTVAVTATYRYQAADGRYEESAPAPQVTVNATVDATITVPTYQHNLIQGQFAQFAQICIYTSKAGSTLPTLQRVVEVNSAVYSTITVGIFNSATSPATEYLAGTALHTNGGGLSNSPAPSARCVQVWRDRVHLSGTPEDGEVWSSQELTEGQGVALNEVLRSFWNDGSGAITGMQPVDWNALALFKRDAVGVLTGQGPTGNGSDGYIPQTLTTAKGLTNSSSLVATPWGAGFQNGQDGRFALVSSGLSVTDGIGQGIDNLRGTSIVSTVLNEASRQVWAYLSDGKLAPLEYAFATPERPFGDWRVWTSAGLARAYGAILTPTGPMHIESNGVLRTPNTGVFTDSTATTPAEVLIRLKTGKLAPFGFQSEGAIVGTKVLGQHISTSTLQISVTADGGTPSVHTKTTSSPFDYYMRPIGAFRSQEVEVTVEETAGSGESFVFEGVLLEVVPHGRSKTLPTAQKI